MELVIVIFVIVAHKTFSLETNNDSISNIETLEEGIGLFFSDIVAHMGYVETVVLGHSFPVFEPDLLAKVEYSISSHQIEMDLLELEAVLSHSVANNNLIVILKPDDLSETLHFITLIGMIETKRQMPRLVFLQPSVFFVIIWPQVLESFEMLKNIIDEDKSNRTNMPNLSSNVYIFCKMKSKEENSDETKWKLLEYYALNSKTILNHVLKLGNHVSTRSNFQRIDIRAAGNLNSTNDYNELQSNMDTNNLRITGGFSGNIIQILEDFLNFRLQPIHERKGLSRDENGEWQGVAKLLFEAGADIAIAKAAYNPMRGKEFTCLIPHFANKIKIFFRQPDMNTVRNLLLLPFELNLWICIVVAMISFLIFIKITNIWKENLRLAYSDEIIIQDSFSWVVGFFCECGWYIQPKATWLRLVFTAGSCTGLILAISYSAVLVSVLSTESTPIKSYDDLIQSQVKLITDNESTTVSALIQREAKDSDIMRKIEMSISSGPAAKLVVGSEDSYGLITFPEVFYSSVRSQTQVSEASLCTNISRVPFTKFQFKAGWIVRKNSPYKEFFNHRIIHLHESGLLHRWKRIYVSTYNPICDKVPTIRSPVDLNIPDLFAAFAIYLSGFILSLIVLMCEQASLRKI